MNKEPITTEGLEKLKFELNQLKSIKRKCIQLKTRPHEYYRPH